MPRDNGLGRLAAPKDGRDFRYLIPMAQQQIVAAVGKPKPRKQAYREGAVLNQGARPICVEFAMRGFINAAPLMKGVTLMGPETEFYRECQRNDEWEGENYDGTSVRAAQKVAQQMGLIESYVWGQTIEQAAEWMNGGFGTVIVGTNWYASMDDVGADGFITLPGTLATPIGGHAYRWNWFDKKRGGILVVNTWDGRWGITKRDGTQSGMAYLRLEDAIRLLHEDGEIAAPTQLKIKATP